MRQKSEWKCGHKIVITLFLRIWRNVSPKKGINFLEKSIYIYTHIYLCEISPKKTHQPISPSQTKKIVRTKKGGKKVKAWQVETPKRWPASVWD